MRFITVFLIFLTTSAFAEKITGKVLRVLDGDTIEISYKKNGDYSSYSNPTKAIIRLNGIDAPESNQPGGRTARNTLIRLTHEKEIVADISSKDKHGRLIGDIYAKEKSLYSWSSSDADMQLLNLEMIKEGMAWHYKQYSSNPTFAKAEVAAKKRKLGYGNQAIPSLHGSGEHKNIHHQKLFPPVAYKHGMLNG